MSKPRKRRRKGQRRARRRRSAEQPPVRLTWKDKLLILGFPVGILVLLACLMGMWSYLNHRRAIGARVENWQAKYGLSESRTLEILEAELDFHTSEHPLSLRSKPNALQREAHRSEIAKLLGTDNSGQGH